MNSFIIIVVSISIAGSFLFLLFLFFDFLFDKKNVILQSILIKIIFIFFLMPAILIPFVYLVQINPVILNIKGEDIKLWTNYVGDNEYIFEKNNLSFLIFLIWLFGFIIIFFRSIFIEKKLIEQMNLLSGKEDVGKIIRIKESILEELNICKKIDIYRTNLINSPCICGILKPKVFLPNMQYSDIEIKLILKHELYHYKRKDTIFNMFILLFLAIHWFNPIIKLFTHQLYSCSEMLCDYYVLKNASKEMRITYAELLIKISEDIIENKFFRLTSFTSHNEKFMKRRLYNIMKMNSKIGKSVLAFGVIVTLVLCPITTYAATFSITRAYNKMLFYTNTLDKQYKNNEELEKIQKESEKNISSIETFSIDNRGRNLVDIKLSKNGKSISDSFKVNKDGSIKVYISSGQSTDKYKVIIKVGKQEKGAQLSENGDMNYTYIATETDYYTVTIQNLTSKEIRVSGTIIIQ